MIEKLLLSIGIVCVLFVYFYSCNRILTLYDKLKQPLPYPPPGVAITRLTLAFSKIIKMDIEVDPKTKEERAILVEIKKIIKTARVLLIIALFAFLALLTFDKVT